MINGTYSQLKPPFLSKISHNNMKTTQEFNRVVVILALILAGFSLMLSSANANVVVVASTDISDDTLSASDVENLFLGKKKSLPGGQKVKVVTLKGGDVHETFLSQYVNKSASQFSAYWKRKIVDGTGIPPKSFTSEQELLDYVKGKANIIGYISDTSGVDGVNVIQIQ